MAKKALLLAIRVYQITLSPFFGTCCRFYPSCSEYAQSAIEKYGAWKGFFKTIVRLSKCHPFCKGGVDLP